MNLIDRIQQKLELFRLEQRYTRRRTTFISEAQYVDGEYIYSPTSPYSAKCSAGATSDSDEERNNSSRRESNTTNNKNKKGGSSKESNGGSSSSGGSGSSRDTKAGRRLSRLMPSKSSDWRKGGAAREDKRMSRVSVREVQWDGQQAAR